MAVKASTVLPLPNPDFSVRFADILKYCCKMWPPSTVGYKGFFSSPSLRIDDVSWRDRKAFVSVGLRGPRQRATSVSRWLDLLTRNLESLEFTCDEAEQEFDDVFKKWLLLRWCTLVGSVYRSEGAPLFWLAEVLRFSWLLNFAPGVLSAKKVESVTYQLDVIGSRFAGYNLGPFLVCIRGEDDVTQFLDWFNSRARELFPGFTITTLTSRSVKKFSDMEHFTDPKIVSRRAYVSDPYSFSWSELKALGAYLDTEDDGLSFDEVITKAKFEAAKLLASEVEQRLLDAYADLPDVDLVEADVVFERSARLSHRSSHRSAWITNVAAPSSVLGRVRVPCFGSSDWLESYSDVLKVV